MTVNSHFSYDLSALRVNGMYFLIFSLLRFPHSLPFYVYWVNVYFLFLFILVLVGKTYTFFADRLNYEEYRKNDKGQRIVYRSVHENATLKYEVEHKESQQALQRCCDSGLFKNIMMFPDIFSYATGAYLLRFPKCENPLTRKEKGALKRAIKQYQEVNEDYDPVNFLDENGFEDSDGKADCCFRFIQASPLEFISEKYLNPGLSSFLFFIRVLFSAVKLSTVFSYYVSYIF